MFRRKSYGKVAKFNGKEAVEARNNYIKENNLEHEYKIQEYKDN